MCAADARAIMMRAIMVGHAGGGLRPDGGTVECAVSWLPLAATDAGAAGRVQRQCPAEIVGRQGLKKSRRTHWDPSHHAPPAQVLRVRPQSTSRTGSASAAALAPAPASTGRHRSLGREGGCASSQAPLPPPPPLAGELVTVPPSVAMRG